MSNYLKSAMLLDSESYERCRRNRCKIHHGTGGQPTLYCDASSFLFASTPYLLDSLSLMLPSGNRQSEKRSNATLGSVYGHKDL